MTENIQEYQNYLITDDGQVFNTTTKKYLTGSISENGYKYYRLSKNGKKKMCYAHILVAKAFLDNPNELPVVNHIDGNKLNNCVDNLEWVSYAQNVHHAHQTGLIAGQREKEYYQDDLKGELWKPIPGLPYSISSMGRVKNDRTNLLLKPSLNCGYYNVRPCVNGQAIDLRIHNLVYCVFNNLNTIPKGMVVDHINGEKTDNRLLNLQLVTLSENVKAAYYKTRNNKSCKKVGQYDKQGKFIASFPSAREAARILNLDSSTISKVCRGIHKSHGGFLFKYLEN